MYEVVINRPSRAFSFGTYRYVYTMSELELRTNCYHDRADEESSYIEEEIKKRHPEMVSIKTIHHDEWVYIGVEMPREGINNA